MAGILGCEESGAFGVSPGRGNRAWAIWNVGSVSGRPRGKRRLGGCGAGRYRDRWDSQRESCGKCTAAIMR
jgi:hypothetical protein